MSRSRKKAFTRCSKPRDEIHRRRERHAIKQVLHTDPFSDAVHADPKELGKDEWGTVFGLEFDDDEDWQKEKEKMRRK